MRWSTDRPKICRFSLTKGKTEIALIIAEHSGEGCRDDEAAWELLARARYRLGNRSDTLRGTVDTKAALEAQSDIDLALREIEAEIL